MAVTTISSSVPQRQYTTFSPTPPASTGTAVDPGRLEQLNKAVADAEAARAEAVRRWQERRAQGFQTSMEFDPDIIAADEALNRAKAAANAPEVQAAAAFANPDYAQTRTAIMDQLNALGGRLGYAATPISDAQQSASNQQAINAQQSLAASARGVNPAMAQRLAAYGTGNALANNAATAAQNAPREALAREQMNQEQYQQYLQALTALNQGRSDEAARALSVKYADEAAKRQQRAQRNQDIKDYVGMGFGTLRSLFGGGG